ncbi:malectin domain-containing carbohydrate-binding protein [Roseobacter sinensis]|uniref:Malectin domain-containing carbohydrate-binding protein n=1 Tax=Roseobacter sinensis TaxID=2931391 RepID=A0ABT3BLG1_9RHOB|nr:malectin domain-containing carbohydrate-binding protein [Roseobacter sp. WL0113]MCV3273959.1 malectin domain-containing carbohydrate-binding protein [Roseobacter sp. WL0113]
MAVTNTFSASTLDLNGVVGLSQPTALVWGPDGRLYVTEVDGDVKVLTVAFGDPDPNDADNTAQFYVTDAVLVPDIKNIPNFNDNGTSAPQNQRQVTGIDVTAQYDANGDPMTLPDGTPMVTMYVTSSDNRIGAGGSGNDAGLDTNSGVITKLTQTGPNSWDAVDIVRGLARSEENHATNGLEVIQEIDETTGKLISERMIVSSGGNANTGAPSNNFAGQQEQPYSGALLEVDLDAINALTPFEDPITGRMVAYDLPTLDDPTRPGTDDNNDPFGGNDGLNSAKLTADSPVQIYSAGYRNAYDVEVTDDGRVFTYDNGANNIWGGRPIGEPNFLDSLYIALNLNNGDGNVNDDINVEAFNPSNNDSLHEATRSDDLDGRELSAGKGGPQLYDWDYGDGQGTLQLVYGGHPNPTRAEGSRAGLLFSPEAGTDNAFLMVSNEDSFGNGGDSDYDEVIAWLTEVENNNTDYPDVFNQSGQRIYGADPGDLTKKVIAMTPGVAYDIYLMPDGSAEIRPEGTTTGLPVGGQYIGTSGLPADIADIVSAPNPIEGNYLEAGSEDGSLDFGKGSVNGLAEYTSTILDDGNTKMSGALLATSLNQGQIYVIGRDENGVVQTNDSGTFTQAADRTTLQAGGGPLGIATLGDDVGQKGLNFAFTGSIWVATFNQNGPLIEVFQPEGVGLPLAGADIVDEEDNDLDGVKDIDDPFEYSPENGYQLSAGETIEIDFNPQNTNFPISLSGTGLLGAALDGVTPNQDARSVEEGFSGDQLQDGLFDNGQNILPGGNAPILKIKTVVDGSVVGSDNDARDVMQTGFRPDPEVDRIALTMSTANWIPSRVNSPLEGQLSGIMFGDGTQFNFLRAVYGGVEGGVGFEVGVEIGDANYTKLATVLVPGLNDGNNEVVDLQIMIDQGNNYAVEVGYRFGTEGDFIPIPLNGGAGYNLPAGVLQDVLNGDHTVQSTGGPVLTSGAAVGFLAEDVPGGDLTDVDFFGLKIESLPNELAANDAASVGQQGTDGADVIIYDGTETDLAPLDDTVEDFDGTQSSADYNVTGNDNDNVFKVGEGANTITTGAGADSIQGTKAQLNGDTITDFTTDDEVIINGVTVNDITVGFEVGSAVVVIDGDTRITFDGPDFADFQAEDGNDIFEFESVAGGVRLVTKDPLTPVIAINAGGDDVPGQTLREQTVNFVSDGPGAPKTGFTVTGDYKAYSSGASNAFDFPGTELDDVLKNERSSASEANWGYAIDVPNGNYLVDLIYAEIFHDLTANNGDPAGKREFDVFIEGDQVEDNYDIIDDAGASGTQVIKTYQVTVTDGVLEIEFNKEVDQAKLSGLVVWAVGGSFEPPADETAPEIAEIFVENPPSVQDGPRDAIVTLTDNAGFEAADFAGLDGSELVFSGIVPSSVAAPTVDISPDGKTATLTYELQPPTDTNAWPLGQGQISIAAGAYGDAAGNTTAAADGVFFVEPNLDNLIAGDVALAINVGPTANTIDTSLEGTDKNTYGGAITGDTIINGINLEADDPSYYTPTTKTGSNIDGKFGPTGSNPALDGSALHTYRDAASGSFTATYPIENGIYVVELWFAELFHSTAGNRQGDYTINGEEFAMDFDAFTEAGAADTAVKITKNVVVTNGQIVIDVNADTGEPGFNAIVVYDAIPSDLPPTISVADVSTAEGEDATITFSRIGDLSEDVTVEYALTDVDTDASDYGTATPATVTILAGQTSATVTLPIVDDEDEEAAESLTVSITSVSNTSNDAVISATGGSATVTIAASDPSTDLPEGGTLLALDFETAGDPLVEGGFDTVLGGATALEAEKISIVGGKLVVNTSHGDLSNVPTDASKNDLVKAVDLSDAGVNDIIISTAFDNPFTAAYLTSIGATGDTIPNYKQQGIIIATGDPATNQNADQFMKVVYGGGGGTQTQMWSQTSVDQPVKLTAVSAAAAAPFANADVARVELALIIDKAAGTIAQFVTYLDGSGAILGGVRPVPTPGFATAEAQPIPAALLTAITNGTSVVGVTSTDFGGAEAAADSFPATWDFVNVTSPQVADPEGPDAVNGTLYVDFSDDGLAPTDVGALANGSNIVVAEQVGDDDGPLGRDRDYFTFEVPEGQVLTSILVTGFQNQEPTDTAGFVGLQEGTQITTDPVTGAGFGDLLGGAIYTDGDDILNLMSQGGDVQGFNFPGFGLPLEAGSYTIWLNQGADLPTTVTLDFVLADRPADVTLSIADAGNVVENGDFGVTVLGFELTASDGFDGTLTVTYDTAIDTGLTQDVTFVGGVGTLTVLVDNDDVDDGAEPVTVTLTSAVDAIGTETVEIVSGSESGNGSVVEDDGPLALVRGNVVYAVNAGGPALTQDGIDFEAGDNATNGAPFTGGQLYDDVGNGGGANGIQPDFTGTIYQTEVNSGPAGDSTPGFFDANLTFDGIDPTKSYFIDLYFAEIFTTDPNARVFDVVIEGQAPAAGSVLDDINPLLQSGNINAPVIIEVPDPVTPGANGTIDLSFVTELDRAKVSAIVIREAVSPIAATPGDVVFAVNAGGGAFTDESGVQYEADAASNWNPEANTSADAGANLPANGDYTGDGIGNADDTVYITERWGGSGTAPDLTFTRDGIPAGEYFLTIKLAEIFNPLLTNGNSRIFDITVNGVQVADDLNLLATAGMDVASDIEVMVTIADEGNGTGTLTIAGDPSADNAKFSGFILREAVVDVPTTDVTISVADLEAEEDGGVANVVFTREGDTTSDVTITFALADGTGVAGVDYEVPASNTVTILAGQTTATVPVTLIDNDADTEVKDFTVTITDVDAAGGESASLGQGSATVTIDDDEDFDPADIDGDGVINYVDPLAYDGDNGLGNVLGVGGSFRQDFDVDTTDVFDADGGFTGILVNTVGFVPPGTSETDPYGDRTTEPVFDGGGNLIEGAEIKDGALKIVATETDTFGSGTPTNQSNQVKDNYVRGADVTGVDLFSVEAKAANPWPTITSGQTGLQFASLGITIGAGGTDDWVKLVYGVRDGGVTVEFASQGSLTSGNQLVPVTYPVDATEAAADLVFRFDVNKSSTTVGLEGLPTLTGYVTLLDSAGNELQTVSTDEKVITGSLLSSLNGQNPLTGGTGGVTYGVSVTEWAGGTGNSFTGEWDYLEISAPDNAPEVDAGVTDQVATEASELDFTLPLDVFKDDNGVANLTLSATLDDDSPLPAWLSFDPDTGRFLGTPADGDGSITVKVTADDGTNPPVSTTFELTVNDIPGPFIWSRDADEDGVGTPTDQIEAYDQPDGYVLASLGTDDDDTDPTVYEGAPEINDGKDNDQDGDIDEDNADPVAGADSKTGMPDKAVTFTRTELMSNDSDADGDALSFSIVPDSGVSGTVSYDAGSGIVTFTPDAGYTGPASFEYRIADAFGGETTQTVSIEISADAGTNATPVVIANDDVSSYGSQDAVEGDMIVDEETQVVTLQGNAWKKVALDGGLTTMGPQTLSLLAESGLTITEGMVLRFTVNSPDIPELMAIGFDNDEDFRNPGTAFFQLGGTQRVGDWNQTYRVYDESVLGTDVTIEIALDAYVGMQFSNMVFINDQDANPTAGTSIYSNIEIVTPSDVNSAPVAAEDDLVMESDAALVIAASELLANDSDPDGDLLTITAVGNAVNGTVTLQNGLITFEADADYDGPASFEYTIEDPSGASSVTTVDITVLPPGGGDIEKDINFNDNPIESYDRQDSKPGAGFEISPAGDSLTLDGNVWKKTAITDGPYEVTENTVLRFEMTILNDSGEIVGIGLENDNSFRSANDVLFQLFGSQNFATWSKQDYNGQYGTVGQPTAYELSLADYAGQSFQTLAFINDDDANGTSAVQFSNVKLVEVLITDPGDTNAPEIFGGEIADQVVTQDAQFEIDLPFFDTDTPFEDLTFSFVNLPAFVTEEDGLLTGTPTNDDVGEYDIAVTATDPEGNSTTGTFTLTVENVNDAPVVTGVYEDVEAIINSEIVLALPDGLFEDVDVGTVLTYAAEGLPEGVTIDAATGEISGTPTESGDFEITITAYDGPVGDPGTLSASTSFTMDVASGPPREAVLIEAEDFTAFTDPNEAFEGFFRSFAGPASGQQVIRVPVGGDGFISTDLDAAGVVPGFYDIAVIHFDESDGAATVTIKMDLGDGSDPVDIGSFVMNKTAVELPGQGNGTQAANITSAVFPTVNIPAGAKLIIEGQAQGGEVLRIDAVRFDPIENTPPAISTPAEATVDEGTLLAADVDATDLEGSEVTYAIVGGADAALFTIDPVTGEVSFVTAPDFEAPGDADQDNVYDVVVSASDGDVASEQALVITVANVEEAPEFSSPTEVDAAENDTAAATVAAVDPDGLSVTYALAGTGADEALFAVDPITGVVTFLTAPDFETPGDADQDGVYEVSVTANDGTSQTTTDLQITVTDANDAPVADPAPEAQPAIIDAPLSLSIVGLFSDQDIGDTLTYTLISGAPAGITEVDANGNLVGTPTEIGLFSVVIEATDGTETVQATLPLNVDAADNTFGPVAPSQDLDGDLVINSLDDDVDGDGILNEADSFAYDADNGTLLADGESIELTFDVNGTPYQNGFTGLLQAGLAGSSALKDFDEDTGATSVAGGLLTTATTTGDTGGTNTPEDDFQLGVKNADFTVEARVINPFETTPAVSFDQIGIHVGVDSTDFVKFVFGNTVEFSSRTDDVEAKATGGNQPLPAVLTGTADFSAVDITLTVNSTSATAATITAVATFLDTNGDPIAGASGVSFGSLNVTGALAAALADETVGVGTGFTHVHAGSSSSFNAQLDSFKVTATDGGSVDPSNALAVFDGEDDLFTGNSYGTDEVGSAVLEVMTGNNNIQSSNFGQNSFQLTNTGDKNIAAVFIDVSTALYPDSVFDPDGAGGDNAFKPWGINSGGAETGASITGGTGGYFLPGQDPLANTTGTGQASNGGFKGAIVKFTNFNNGETVGFSGDMDPNSLAGLDKGGSNGVDTNAINGWDAGGISGHEIIGSTFTILFDDGTTATGQLASDGSAAGSQGVASEAGFASDAPTLVVNGFAAGEVGTYGGEQPTILVTGDPGAIVRITMTKGFDPVGNTANGIDALVEDRLERYDFKASNAFDAQSVDVTIGPDGTFDATGLFDYDDNLAYNGTFAGDDVAEIGFVAVVVDPSQGNLPVSPVTKPIYLANEGGPVEGDPVGNDGTNALEVFAGETDLITNATYADGVTGSAVLDIMAGVSDIDGSNFGANSFQVTNTGGKKISAVFIDVSDAVYQDAVFDPDGAGGDNVAKPWAVNSAGGTGAYISGGTGGYFLPGQDPLANTTGTGQPSNGGFKGAIVKFTDFDTGETVGFSGDMDPNSIAGLLKSGVDAGATDSWDVGGISGHELIGSRFTVLFDDGTTASGQLGSDGSASGSQALADQGLTKATTPTLEVNGVAAGGTGTYGVTQPTIIVTGDVGDTVRITMTKGFNPVENTANGIAQLVEDRLDRYDFKANNNFDSQSVDVVIGPDGTFDATGLFDYDDAVANNNADGTFPGDDVAQIAFVASVIDTSNNDLPISDLTAPIVLTNQGGPVTGDPVIPIDGYFEIINNTRFKIQIEDENANGGTTPGGLWTYLDAPDGLGRQSGFQGDGYYLFGSNTSTAITGVSNAATLEYTIFIPEEAVGVYTFNFRVSRDGVAAGDQQNDLWLNFKKFGTSETIEEYLTETTDEAEPTSQGFIKVFGGPNNGTWGNANGVDGLPGNFPAQIEITEGGLYTIEVAGRSQGFHVDYLELYQGGQPGAGASNSAFVEGDPGDPVDPGDQIIASISASSDDWEEFGGAGSADLEFGLNGAQSQSVGMRFTNIDIPADKVIAEAYFQFEANGTETGPASFTIEIEATESAATYSAASTPDDRTYLAEDFDWNDVEPWTDGQTYRTPDIADLIEAAIGADGVLDGELGFRITGTGARAAHSFDSDGEAPELVILFEEDLIA